MILRYGARSVLTKSFLTKPFLTKSFPTKSFPTKSFLTKSFLTTIVSYNSANEVVSYNTTQKAEGDAGNPGKATSMVYSWILDLDCSTRNEVTVLNQCFIAARINSIGRVQM